MSVNDIAVKYLLRRCEACVTASEVSSFDEVKFLPSAKVVGLRPQFCTLFPLCNTLLRGFYAENALSVHRFMIKLKHLNRKDGEIYE